MQDLQSWSDNQLAVAMRDQDSAEAFVALRSRHFDAVESYLKERTNDHPDAAVIRDKVWNEIWDGRSRYDEVYPFKSVLWTLTRQRLNDWLRRIYRINEVQMDDDLMKWIESLADPHQDQEFKLCFWRAWKRLPKEYQDVIRWRCLDGLTQEEVAARLGRSLPFARKRERLAKALLKRFLEAEGIYVN